MSKSKSNLTGRRVTPAVRPSLQLKVLSGLIGVALAQMAAPSWADSGTGVDTNLGNTLNPGGVSTATLKDPEGMGNGFDNRNPSGFLLTPPWQIEPWKKADNGWQYRGSAEVGVMGLSGDKGAAKFNEYKALKGGLYLNNFKFEAEKPETANYLEIVGGGVGRKDQFLGLTYGQYNGLRLKSFYNETNHVYTSTYRNLWNFAGSSNVKLANLPPGGTTDAATTDINIGKAALATPYSTLSVLRQKGGIRIDMPLSDAWKTFATFTSERRTGTRPFGMVSGGGGGTGGVEIPESIDYNTHDVAVGAQWNNSRTSVNLTGSGSFFRNNVGTMTIENPMFLAAANGITKFPTATYDLYPNNDFYNLKGEFAHAIPEFWNGRVTGLYSTSTSRQNDALIPMTSYAGANVNGVAGGAWNTVASLSQPTADRKLDSHLLDLGLGLSPAKGLDVKAKFRQYETINRSTEYFACNPLTGQWGRLVNDGSGSAMLNNPTYEANKCNVPAIQALKTVPSAGNINIAAIPYQYKQTTAGLTGDYRIDRGNSVNATLERETYDRANRERAQTWEDKFKLGFVNRSMSGGTLRLSAEYDRRRGSKYNSDPYEEFYSSSLGANPTAAGTNVTSWIHINDLHRKFDLADRNQTIVNARFNYPVRADLDVGFSGQFKNINYTDSAYGRNGQQNTNTLNLDVTWQPTNKTSLYAYGSVQTGTMSQKGIQQNACAIGSTYYFFSDGSIATSATPTAAQTAAGIAVVGNSGAVTSSNYQSLCGTASATSPLYPTSRAWTASQSDFSTVFGLGLKQDIGTTRFDLNYTYSRSRSGISYTYNPVALGLQTSGAATAAQNTAVGLVSTGMPDLIFVQQIVDASLLIPVNKSTSVRLIARYELGKFNDWHYDGVAANPTPSTNQQTYLDSGPQGYRAMAVGAVMQIRF